MEAEAGQSPATPTGAERPEAIFILGMLPRTGTNHLADLFELHRDVAVLKPVFEDHLVRFSPLLTTYVDEVTRHWSPEWEVPADEPARLLAEIGGGVVRWICSPYPGKTVVTKMPRVENVGRFFDLFPNCGLVILTRDGRSVVESGVRSFDWPYEFAFRMWNNAAEEVLRFREANEDQPRLQIVRYEDLIDDESTVMARLFGAFGLDPQGFNPAAVEELPVRGSSLLAESGSLHWDPVARPDGFDPRERWRSWDQHLHRRFNAVAGAAQQDLGYAVEPSAGEDSVTERAASLQGSALARWRETKASLRRMRRVVTRTWW